MDTEDKKKETTSTLIPEQNRGNESGSHYEVEAPSREQAVELFKIVRMRLLDINHWKDISKAGGASFNLLDAAGNSVSRDPVVGDLIRMKIPGPGLDAGGGYDWVRIEAIDDKSDPVAENESVSFRARPVKKPCSESQSIAHFYTSDATSTFIVARNGNKLIAREVGNNEIANTDISGTTDKIRNTIIAGGAQIGLSAAQWKSLMKGLLMI